VAAGRPSARFSDRSNHIGTSVCDRRELSVSGDTSAIVHAIYAVVEASEAEGRTTTETKDSVPTEI